METVEGFLSWRSYSVRKSDKQPLLNFIIAGLLERGCRVISSGDANRAPFLIVFEGPLGDRQAVLVYAFLANAKPTKNRPDDEHRFQAKYGGDLKGTIDVATDPSGVIATLFLGIDPSLGIFVAADPLMNSPTPMSRSIEFKSRHVEKVMEIGWAAWERDRHPPKTKTRPGAELEDLRTEVLIGGRRDRVLDLITLERMASGLDPGERHLVADRLSKTTVAQATSHPILGELGLDGDALFDLISGASRLKMAVRGWVAEKHLVDHLAEIDGVSDCVRLEGDGRPDVSLRWLGGKPIFLECKNTLRETYADGRPKLDFQRTRAAKGDPCSRYYSPSDFQVVAACLHAVTERWEYQFALTTDLEPHKSCAGKIASAIAVSEPIFTKSAGHVFYKCSPSQAR